jgi:hypothetical protein
LVCFTELLSGAHQIVAHCSKSLSIDRYFKQQQQFSIIDKNKKPKHIPLDTENKTPNANAFLTNPIFENLCRIAGGARRGTHTVSQPFNVQHNIHVNFDSKTGFEGLPAEWEVD